MQTPLRVHIIPIGDDKVGRIINPTKISRPDRIYLINFRGKTLFDNVRVEIKKALEKQNIVSLSELFEIECDFYNFTEVLQTYARIIRGEQQKGNAVFFNVSTGGKLNSLAGMFACLLFGATPYFCKQDFEREIIPDPPDILVFPKYHIEKPPADLVRFLLELQNRDRGQLDPKYSKGECLEVMQDLNPKIRLSGKTSGDYNKLKFHYLDKLIERGYITIAHGIRGKVMITEEGKFATQIFAPYYGLIE